LTEVVKTVKMRNSNERKRMKFKILTDDDIASDSDDEFSNNTSSGSSSSTLQDQSSTSAEQHDNDSTAGQSIVVRNVELATLLAMERLLLLECNLKLAYSQQRYVPKKLCTTLDSLGISSDLRAEIIVLVPSLVEALERLAKCRCIGVR